MNRLALEAFERMEPSEADAYLFADPARRNFIRAQIVNFPAYVLPDPERATVVCGIVHAFGLGEVWMVKSRDFRRSAPIVLPLMRDLIAGGYAALGLRRLSLAVEAGRADAALWARRLGFAREATLRAAHPRGGDVDVFVWEGKA